MIWLWILTLFFGDADGLRYTESWRILHHHPDVLIWDDMDARLDQVRGMDAPILLNFTSDAGDWACDMAYRAPNSCVFLSDAAFRVWVQTAVKRSVGAVDYYQFGDNWSCEAGYIGAASDFVRFHNMLYDAVQLHTPQTPVVLGDIHLPLCDWERVRTVLTTARYDRVALRWGDYSLIIAPPLRIENVLSQGIDS